MIRSADILSRDICSRTVSLLEEERAAATDEFSRRHDGDSVAEVVSLVHEVCRQQHGSTLTRLLQNVPNLTSRLGVHTARRFIQDDYLVDDRAGKRYCKISSMYRYM